MSWCTAIVAKFPDEGYSRNASCALNYISTFLTKIDWLMSNVK